MLKKIVHNKYLIIIFILIFILLIATGTYAWLTWSSSDSTRMILTVGEAADVVFDEGNSINAVDLSPAFTPRDGKNTTFSIIKNKNALSTNIGYTISLNISSISEELKSNNFKYVLTKDGTEVTSGNFSVASANSTINIYSDTLSASRVDYEFIIYIDGNVENNTNMMNKKLTGTINVTISE